MKYGSTFEIYKYVWILVYAVASTAAVKLWTVNLFLSFWLRTESLADTIKLFLTFP